MAEEGYTRSSKKCKEKFENVQQPTPSGVQLPPGEVGVGVGVASSLFSRSSNTSSSTPLSGSDGEDTAEEARDEGGGSRKQKRCGKSESAGKKMRSFFKGLMKKVLEGQESMQRKFLEKVEKREQERMAREEAWRRQAMAEREIAASRDASIITLLQNITGQSVQLPQMPPMNVNVTPPPPYPTVVILPPSSSQQTPQPPQHVQRHRLKTLARRRPPVTSSEANPPSRETTATKTATADSASESRWPKPEVDALINMRFEMKPRYRECGPKGRLWVGISSAMKKMGYNKSSKRCKEKWGSINGYYKKVKESSKKGRQYSKTCPYFDQLDALYCKKGGGGGGNGQQTAQQETLTEPINPDILPITTLPPAAPTQHTLLAHGRGASEACGASESMAQHLKTSNGDHPQAQCFSEGGGTSSANDDVMKKPEDTVKEMMKRSRKRQSR